MNTSTTTPTPVLSDTQAAWLGAVTAATLGVHVGANGLACTCKPCRHRVVTIARQRQVPANLIAAKVWRPVAHNNSSTAAARRPRLTGSVVGTGTVTVGGQRMTGTEAIIALSRAR